MSVDNPTAHDCFLRWRHTLGYMQYGINEACAVPPGAMRLMITEYFRICDELAELKAKRPVGRPRKEAPVETQSSDS